MKNSRKISIKQLILTTAITLTVLLTVIYSDSVRKASQDAVSNCLNIIIPSIFPMMALSFFMTEAGFPVKIKSFTNKLLIILFGLNGNCLDAVIPGLTGGYNTAVKCALRLYEGKRIDIEQAKRIALFFTNPGISFTVILTGLTLNGSLITGIRIYLFSVLISIIFAYIYNRFNRYTAVYPSASGEFNISSAFINAVEKASSGIISISFNIIFFAGMSAVFSRLLPFDIAGLLITLTGEVSSGVIYSSEHFPVYITAGVIAFGGFCIFIQNFKDLKKLEISTLTYFSVRIIYAISAATAEYIFSFLFPSAITTANIVSVRLSSSDGVSGTLALIFLCAVFLVSVQNIKNRSTATKKVL